MYVNFFFVCIKFLSYLKQQAFVQVGTSSFVVLIMCVEWS